MRTSSQLASCWRQSNDFVCSGCDCGGCVCCRPRSGVVVATIYMLYDPLATGKAVYNIGGGSSTAAYPRIYLTLKQAERMQARHFPETMIHAIHLTGGA